MHDILNTSALVITDKTHETFVKNLPFNHIANGELFTNFINVC